MSNCQHGIPKAELCALCDLSKLKAYLKPSTTEVEWDGDTVLKNMDNLTTPKVSEIEELAIILHRFDWPSISWKEKLNVHKEDYRDRARIVIQLGYHRTTSSVELVEALEMAINTVECDSYGLDSKGNKFELPWYRAAKKALAKFKGDGK